MVTLPECLSYTHYISCYFPKPLNPLSPPGKWYYFSASFSDEKLEIQRIGVTCPKSHSGEGA